jgi:signal transduction histidine kinase
MARRHNHASALKLSIGHRLFASVLLAILAVAATFRTTLARTGSHASSRAEQARRQWVAHTSHELRSPLAARWYSCCAAMS